VEDESSTFGLRREKLAKLWKMGEDTPDKRENGNAESPRAELLQAQLAESLSLDAGMNRMLPDIVHVVLEKLKPFIGCSYRDILLNPETDLSVLETIKDLHKQRAESTTAEAQHEVMTVIYYLSIAAALVHRDVRITKLSYRRLKQSFAELSEYNWLPPDVKGLLSEAHQCCIRRIHKAEKSDDRRK